MSDDTIDSFVLLFMTVFIFSILLVGYLIDDTEPRRFKAYMEKNHVNTTQEDK